MSGIDEVSHDVALMKQHVPYTGCTGVRESRVLIVEHLWAVAKMLPGSRKLTEHRPSNYKGISLVRSQLPCIYMDRTQTLLNCSLMFQENGTTTMVKKVPRVFLLGVSI